MQVSVPLVKEVRKKTGLGLKDVVDAFKNASTLDDVYIALSDRENGIAARQMHKNAMVQVVDSYVHNGKFGAMAKFSCETDFVARSEEFRQFMHDICMHVAATPLPDNIHEIYMKYSNELQQRVWDQYFIKDESKTLRNLLAEISAKTREKIEIIYLVRLSVC